MRPTFDCLEGRALLSTSISLYPSYPPPNLAPSQPLPPPGDPIPGMLPPLEPVDPEPDPNAPIQIQTGPITPA